MKKIEIACGGCGAKLPLTIGEGHKSVAKCDCGATTYVETSATGPESVLKDLNALVAQIPAILQQWKGSKRKGFESGFDEALHQVVKEMSSEILQSDPELSEALKERIRASLEDGLLGPENGKEAP